MPLHDIQTHLPVYINGFFDLDSSRQTLTTNHETLGGKAVFRADWNIQLVKLCVARAYATLITSLAYDIGLSRTETFYKYWPDPDKDEPDPLRGLPTNVYRYLDKAPVLRSADPENEWCNIRSLLLLPNKWQSELRDPLIADSMTIPQPELPAHILRGYKLAEIDVNTVTPAGIRSRLRVSEDIDKPIAEVERLCLRNRKWITSLLRFCLSDSPTTDLVGVPLAILADEHLHTFGKFNADSVEKRAETYDFLDSYGWTASVKDSAKETYFGAITSNSAFLADEKEREIFADFREWFVDPSFATECDLRPIPDAGLKRMYAGIVIDNLNRILEFPITDSKAPWNPQSASIPNTKWLRLVYEYLSLHDNEVLQREESLKQLHLVPDQFGCLWQPSLAETPLIPREDMSQDLRKALTHMGIPIVTGSEELVSAIRDFQKKVPEGFIWKLAGIDFVYTLSAFAHEWQSQYSSYAPEIHDPLLDFLSDRQVIDNLKQNQDRIAKLIALPIYPTIDGKLVCANEPGLYLPANYDYDPLTGVKNLRLLDTGADGRWKPLFRLLKIEELDRPTLIQEVLLPDYQTLTPTEQVRVLEWIRDNLNSAETEQTKKNLASDTLITELIAKSPLILCTDGEYHACRDIYDPRQDQPIRAVLGDTALFPDMKMYHDDEERWLKFFTGELGMASAPRASAILGAIDKLIAEGVERGVPSVSDRLRSIFDYIARPENRTRLSQENVNGSNMGDVARPFAELLSTRRWLPAQRDERQLSRYAAYKVPEDRLYQPQELYMARMGHLVASQMPLAVIGEPGREITKLLGFAEYPPLSLVIEHFDAILTQWSLDDHGGIKEDILARSVGEIYRFFGGLKDPVELNRLKTHYVNRECLWHPHKKLFFQPNHVFREHVQNMEPRRTHIVVNDIQQDQGYSNLGRTDTPTVKEFIEFLNDIKQECGETILADGISRQVVMVLRQISAALMSDTGEWVFPVLTQTNRLIDCTTVFVPDALWLQDKLDEGEVHLLHSQVPRDLIERIRIRRLSKSIKEKLTHLPSPSNSPELQQQCNQLQRLIRSREFHAGLERLIHAVHGYVKTGEFKWLEQTKIRAVHEIAVDLWLLEEGASDRKVGSGNMNSFFDPEEFTIFLARQKPTVLYPVLGQAINSQLDEFRLSDTAPLTSILNCNPEEINEILTALHVPELLEDAQVEVDLQEFSESVDQIGGNDDESLSDTGEVEIEDKIDELQVKEGKSNKEAVESNDQTVPIEAQSPSGVSKQTPGHPPRSQESDSEEIDDEQEEREEDQGVPQQEQANRHNESSGFGQGGNGGYQHSRLPMGADIPPPTQPGAGKSPVSEHLGENGSGDNYPAREPRAEKTSERRSRSHTRNDRIFISGVYPHPDQELELGETDSQRDAIIGKRAVDRVIEHETRQGLAPKPMPHNNPGYDIEVYAADGQALLKYIEVKGIDGSWGEGGVNIRARQYAFGQQHPDEFWLYVVEYALDDSEFKIYPIHNPINQITHYRFDHGWKELAKVESNPVIDPQVGLYVLLQDGAVGVIVKVEGMGSLKSITVRFEDGQEKRVMFNPTLMKLTDVPER